MTETQRLLWACVESIERDEREIARLRRMRLRLAINETYQREALAIMCVGDAFCGWIQPAENQLGAPK